MGAEVGRSIDGTRMPVRRGHWSRSHRRRRMEDCGLLCTQGAIRFCCQACKQFGLSGVLTAWHEGGCWSRASDASTRPDIKEHDKEPHECDQCELVEKQVVFQKWRWTAINV